MANEVEDQEVFEITDFTTASEWERFIARIEEIIHEWQLVNVSRRPSLRKINPDKDSWKETFEELTFADVKFILTHYSLIEEYAVKPCEAGESEETKASLPQSLEDMMAVENDFPPRAHCLCRWFGLREFLVISPVEGGEAVTSESRSNLLLSSITIAINNTNCQIPMFVQIHQRWRKLYFGQCEAPGIRTDFDMVHLKKAPTQFYHLSGLLDIFRGKLASPVSPLPPTKVSVRITYQLQDWTQHAWPQGPPDITVSEVFASTSSFMAEFGTFPFGASEEPINELLLAATWPSLTEDWVIDNDIHSDLDPLEAPFWSVRITLNKDSQCLMGDYLKEFLKHAQGKIATDMALIQEDDEECSEFPQALQKLTGPDPNILKSVVSRARTTFQRKSKEGIIPKDLLDDILIFLFPDAIEQPEKHRLDSILETTTVRSRLDFIVDTKDTKSKSHELDWEEEEKDEKNSYKHFKSAPEKSLTYRLALCTCYINYNYEGLPALAHLWNEFVLEMRFRWENNILISDLENGSPNLASCLLHQKLQMLNCCIEKKLNRELNYLSQSSSRKLIRSGSLWKNDEVPSKVARKSSPESFRSDDEKDDDDNDEFFECQEEFPSPIQSDDSFYAPASSNSDSDQAEGRLRRCRDLNLINSNIPLYIPITQEPAPMTEDMLEQQAEVLIQLGTNSEGTNLRARMQSASLLSDMESFKAANPGSVLEDFVRWYSPRDWIEQEVSPDGDAKGSLSSRMLLPGNMWQEVWDNAKPIPVYRQKRLFDDTKEAEKVLHFLSVLKPAELVLLLIPVIIHIAVKKLQDEGASVRLSSKLKDLLESIVSKIPKVVRAPKLELGKFKEIIDSIITAEEILAQLKSLHNKFDITQEKNKVKQAELEQFICKLLDEVEVNVSGAGKGLCGTKIRNLFTEIQKATHMIIDDLPLASSGFQNSQHHLTVPEFPEPVGREFILRNVVSRPGPRSRPTPQRMFCILLKDDFRLAGAFTQDTTFQ